MQVVKFWVCTGVPAFAQRTSCLIVAAFEGAVATAKTGKYAHQQPWCIRHPHPVADLVCRAVLHFQMATHTGQKRLLTLRLSAPESDPKMCHK